MQFHFNEEQAWKEIEKARQAGVEFTLIGPVLDDLRAKAMKSALSDDEYAATPHMRDRHIAKVNALDDIKRELDRIMTRGQSAETVLKRNQRNV